MGKTPEEKEKIISDWASGISGIESVGKKSEASSLAGNAKNTLVNIQEQYDDIFNEDFTYNAAYDPLFQSYADQYIQKGQMAMKNAIAESSILTGGYGNSWATAAGVQAFNAYMDELNGIIPELRAAAYDEWSADKNAKLGALEDDLAAQSEIVDAAYGAVDDIVAKDEKELINYIAQGVIDGIITEDDIDAYLPAYDDTFTDEEIAALTDEVLATIDAYKLMEAEELAKQNGVVADILQDVIKNPDLNNEKYLTAAFGEHGLEYEQFKDRFEFDAVDTADANDGKKTPTSTMYSAALAAYEESDDAYIKYVDSIPEYSEKMLDEYITKHSNRYKRQGIQERNYYIANEDDDTRNGLWGNDYNDTLSYEDADGNVQKIKVKELMDELIALGMSKKEAKDWIYDNIPKKYEEKQ